MNRVTTAIAILAISSLPAFVQAQTNPYPPVGTPPTTTTGTPVQGGLPQHGEHHPEMHKALKQLENAKETLQHAAHDYSGHRDQAIALIDQAEAQIKLGLESDRH